MIVGNGAEPSDIDPQTITGIPERNIVVTLFEGLTRVDPATLEPQPGVAERWEISADTLTYTFHLRAGLQWSDGHPLTAHDFVASFRRLLAPELGSDNAENLYHVVNAEAFHKGQITDFAAVGFRVPDDRTLEVRLRYPTPFLLKTMAARSWFPVPRHVIDRLGPPFQPGSRWTRPGSFVGNGPFVLQEWKPNVHLEVRRSPTYWNRSTVRLGGVRFIPMESQTAEEAAFRAGQLHKTSHLPLNKIPVYQREAPEQLRIHPYSGVYFYSFNVKRPPFDDVRMRRALAHAVDRASLVRNVTRGGETAAHHFVPDAVGRYPVTESMQSQLDFEAARRLLSEAGFPGGKGLAPITLLYNTAENHRAIAEAVQQTWRRELGIDVRLENQEWKVYLDNMHNRSYQVCRAGLVIEPYDPSQFLRVLTTGDGFNRTGWSNAEYDQLYGEVMQTADAARRIRIFQRMEEILNEEMPILPVYFVANQYLLRPNIRGWVDNLLTLGPYERAWIE